MKVPLELIFHECQVRGIWSVRSAPEGISRKALLEQNHRIPSLSRLTILCLHFTGIYSSPAPTWPISAEPPHLSQLEYMWHLQSFLQVASSKEMPHATFCPRAISHYHPSPSALISICAILGTLWNQMPQFTETHLGPRSHELPRSPCYLEDKNCLNHIVSWRCLSQRCYNWEGAGMNVSTGNHIEGHMVFLLLSKTKSPDYGSQIWWSKIGQLFDVIWVSSGCTGGQWDRSLIYLACARSDV